MRWTVPTFSCFDKHHWMTKPWNFYSATMIASYTKIFSSLITIPKLQITVVALMNILFSRLYSGTRWSLQQSICNTIISFLVVIHRISPQGMPNPPCQPLDVSGKPVYTLPIVSVNNLCLVPHVIFTVPRFAKNCFPSLRSNVSWGKKDRGKEQLQVSLPWA